VSKRSPAQVAHWNRMRVQGQLCLIRGTIRSILSTDVLPIEDRHSLSKVNILVSKILSKISKERKEDKCQS